MAGCQSDGCRNDAHKRGMCPAHWQLDMITRKRARAERERAWRRAQPIELESWCDRQRRIVGSMIERVQREGSDLEAAVRVAHLVEEMDAALGALFVNLHDHHGYSWTDIADALGMTRQGARQRFVVRPSARNTDRP